MRHRLINRKWLALALTLGALLALPPRGVSPQIAAPNFKIEDLAWMSGHWQTAPGRAQSEEHWTHAAGGTLFGVSRTIAGGKTVFFEYLRVETRGADIYYVAHPKARNPGTDFKLARMSAGEAVFENLAHDFPKRIIYRKNADGTMTARIEGNGTEKEKPQDFHFRPLAQTH
ncbi:MAG: DUF6265 family protein [Blastocatellia bacterium]